MRDIYPRFYNEPLGRDFRFGLVNELLLTINLSNGCQLFKLDFFPFVRQKYFFAIAVTVDGNSLPLIMLTDWQGKDQLVTVPNASIG